MAKTKTTLVVGDEVRYTAMFLQSTGQHTGAAPFRHGKVIAIDHYGETAFATVEWNDIGRKLVNTFNICRINSPASYAL